MGVSTVAPPVIYINGTMNPPCNLCSSAIALDENIWLRLGIGYLGVGGHPLTITRIIQQPFWSGLI